MSRSVSSPRLAVERLADELSGDLLVMPTKSGWEIMADPELGVSTMSSKDALAFLADLAMRRPDSERIRDEVNWAGNVPQSGLSGWQEYALLWLRYGSNLPTD